MADSSEVANVEPSESSNSGGWCNYIFKYFYFDSQ